MSMNLKPRKPVAITGCGVVTAFGSGLTPLMSGLHRNASAFSLAPEALHKAHPQVAVALAPSNPSPLKPFLLAMEAAEMAIRAADWSEDRRRSHRTLLIVATTKANIEVAANYYAQPSSSEHLAPGLLYSLTAQLSEALGFAGPRLTLSVACASGLSAVGRAWEAIQTQSIDRALVVGTDAASMFVYGGFSNLGALSTNGAQPFDQARSGLSIGEGASALALEVRPHGTLIAGYGSLSDANHITGPARDGRGLIGALNRALDTAHLSPAEIGFGIAHGTGTKFNDAMEGQAYLHVFGEKALPVMSLKGAIGHLMGAAGVINLVIAAQALKDQVCPPNVGLNELDPSLPLDVIHTHPRPVDTHAAITSASGFGGVNSAVALKLAAEPTAQFFQPSDPSPKPGNVSAFSSDTLHAHPSRPASVERPTTPSRRVVVSGYTHIQIDRPQLIRQLGARVARRLDDACLVALSAAQPFMTGRRSSDHWAQRPHALVLGTALGSMQSDHAYYQREQTISDTPPSPRLFAYTLPNIALGEVAIHHQLTGEQRVVSAGRVSSLAALVEGIKLIESGSVETALVFCIDAPGPALQAQLGLKPHGSAWCLQAESSLSTPGHGFVFGEHAGGGQIQDAAKTAIYTGDKGLAEFSAWVSKRQSNTKTYDCPSGYRVTLAFCPQSITDYSKDHRD